MESMFRIGIDAGGTKVAYGLFDGRGALVGRLRHDTDASADGPAFSDMLIEGIRTLTDRYKIPFRSLAGIGVSMPSFILYDEGRILMTSSIPGIKDFPMRAYLSDRLPAPIVLDNDANAAALAEYRHGAGRGTRHMVYIVIGTGLGSGIIIDGKVFQGSYGWAGECGHMLATPGAGILCGCENEGCYMAYTSGKFLPERVKLRLDAGVQSVLTGEADGRSLLEAYDRGDALAAGVLDEMAHYLAVCVFNVYQMLNINTFVFGGGLINLGEALFGRMRRDFDRVNHIPMPVRFLMAELKQDAGILGAAEFVREDTVR
ncbi:MAG: ROK family protein [Clostridia bacterium]|nr:ROK family protein [Clostridia bacterium]